MEYSDNDIDECLTNTDNNYVANENIYDTLMAVIPEYERYTDLVTNSVRFNGHNLSYWSDLIKLPSISQNMDIPSIQNANIEFIRINELIMHNLAIAKSSFQFACMNYNIALSQNKQRIRDAIDAYNRRCDTDKKLKHKRMPGVDALEAMASTGTMKEFSAMKMAEIFLDFWQTGYLKMQTVNSRLNSLGYLETKTLH